PATSCSPAVTATKTKNAVGWARAACTPRAPSTASRALAVEATSVMSAATALWSRPAAGARGSIELSLVPVLERVPLAGRVPGRAAHVEARVSAPRRGGVRLGGLLRRRVGNGAPPAGRVPPGVARRAQVGVLVARAGGVVAVLLPQLRGVLPVGRGARSGALVAPRRVDAPGVA